MESLLASPCIPSPGRDFKEFAISLLAEFGDVC
jgi:hypothetical protein